MTNQFEEAVKKLGEIREEVIKVIYGLGLNKQIRHQRRLLRHFERIIRCHESGQEFRFLLDGIDINKYDNDPDEIWEHLYKTDSLRFRNEDPINPAEYTTARDSLEKAVEFIELANKFDIEV